MGQGGDPLSRCVEEGACTIHPTAEVSPLAKVGARTRVWHQAQVREGARIGRDCAVGKGAYIDHDVLVGDRVKIQNYASIYYGARVESEAFIGPYACLTNDRLPRAATPEGELKDDADWKVERILVGRGASIGACAVVLPGVRIGEFALVGAGAVVTRDVPDFGLVVGNPARLQGFVCRCGGRLSWLGETTDSVLTRCTVCRSEISIPRQAWSSCCAHTHGR